MAYRVAREEAGLSFATTSSPFGSPKSPTLVRVHNLRPTQTAVGMRAVAAKRRRLASKGRKLVAFLRERPIPAVLGPRKALYIVDRHHMTAALLQSGVDHAFAHVIGDLSHLTTDNFWFEMVAEGWAHPFSVTGARVSHRCIPTSIADLRADPYRDIAWSVREAGGFAKSWVAYSEFRWANFFRTSIDPRVVAADYDRAVSIALRLARSSSASHLPGYLGRGSEALRFAA